MNDGGRSERVDELLSPLRDGDAREPLPINRERVVARMMGVAAQGRPRAWRTGPVMVFAMAATVALVVGALRWVRPAAQDGREVAILSLGGEVTWRGAKATPLAPGQSATGDATGDVETASGEARLRASSGVEIDLVSDTHVSLDGLAERSASVRLLAGKVRCRVPHLGPSHTFSVVTKDVQVVVHGTAFSVETSREGTTSVRVDEGVVVVHHPAGEVRLTASQSWTNAPPPPAPPAPPSVSTPSPRRSAEVIAPPRSRGTLAQETRLLRSGLAAERGGDLTSATASFDRLLARFPRSPLAPDARAALARVRAHQRAAP